MKVFLELKGNLLDIGFSARLAHPQSYSPDYDSKDSSSPADTTATPCLHCAGYAESRHVPRSPRGRQWSMWSETRKQTRWNADPCSTREMDRKQPVAAACPRLHPTSVPIRAIIMAHPSLDAMEHEQTFTLARVGPAVGPSKRAADSRITTLGLVLAASRIKTMFSLLRPAGGANSDTHCAHGRSRRSCAMIQNHTEEGRVADHPNVPPRGTQHQAVRVSHLAAKTDRDANVPKVPVML
ncbi:hypothetical protein EV126DRAFT_145466 [Verticillium dahliae]|nr:hypothetical protein EV126DRAFT_145466 [Verticillium dahliae]